MLNFSCLELALICWIHKSMFALESINNALFILGAFPLIVEFPPPSMSFVSSWLSFLLVGLVPWFGAQNVVNVFHLIVSPDLRMDIMPSQSF